MRPHTFYRPGPLEEYMKEANEATKVFAQIETAAGVDNAEKILSAEGVSGFMLGPNDLSCDLGCVKDAENRILPLISELSRKAAALGKSSRNNHVQSGVSGRSEIGRNGIFQRGKRAEYTERRNFSGGRKNKQR